MIEADQVYRSYTLAKKKIEVLRGVNLKIESGEKVFLCGPSGAGKTTLMYTLAGLENPHEGRVLIDGTDFYKLSSSNQASLRNEKIGYIFQNYFLLPELTAIENVMVPGLIGLKADRELAKSALCRVGLSERAEHRPAELSGGQQQRVAVARAIVHKPSIILCDEPTGNLDTSTSNEVMELLKTMNNELNTTFLIVTHDREIAKQCERIITMSDGLVVNDQRKPGSEEE